MANNSGEATKRGKSRTKPTRNWRNRIVGHGEVADPAQLLANPLNWRIHPKAQQDALAGVLAEVGWVQDVIVNKRSGFVVDGHARVALAIAAGEPVPVVYVDLSEEEERLILATLDPLSAMAVTDKGLLGDLLKDLEVTNEAVMAMLAGLQGLAPKDGLTDPDAVPETPAAPVSKLGDVWLLGEHRVLCGDSTDVGSVSRLMGGRKADIVFTSPPYDQQRAYQGKIADWLPLVCGVFGVLPTHETTQVLVNLGIIHRDGEWVPYWEPFVEYMRGEGWRRFGWYVWDQGPGLPGDWNGRLAPSHEFIFHFNREAENARKVVDCKWAGSENHGKGLRAKSGVVSEYTAAGRSVQSRKIPDSVFRVVRHKARGIECQHPAVFPVQFAREAILAFSDIGDSVYDPFSGSGTTLLACETERRHCFGIEIEPAYVDVIIERWQQFSGKMATHEETGETFENVKLGRLGVH